VFADHKTRLQRLLSEAVNCVQHGCEAGRRRGHESHFIPANIARARLKPPRTLNAGMLLRICPCLKLARGSRHRATHKLTIIRATALGLRNSVSLGRCWANSDTPSLSGKRVWRSAENRNREKAREAHGLSRADTSSR
jgi:hypothetical protein